MEPTNEVHCTRSLWTSLNKRVTWYKSTKYTVENSFSLLFHVTRLITFQTNITAINVSIFIKTNMFKAK